MIRESSADGAPESAWSSRGGENRAAVLFDVDGVLLDSTAVHRRVWDAWSRTHALNPETVWPLTFGRRPEDTVADAAPHLDPAVERRFLDDLLAREHHAIRPMPGAASLLAALSRTPWAIVTSNTRPFVVCGSVGTPAGPAEQLNECVCSLQQSSRTPRRARTSAAGRGTAYRRRRGRTGQDSS